MKEEIYMKAALKLVRAAGNVIRTAFATPVSSIKTKASNIDLVTETDHQVETLIFDGLRAQFPDHRFIGEESAGHKFEWTDHPTWICDPIDGTTNFVHRCPHICISLGLTIKKELRLGIVYNPILDQLYTALAGGGAYMNGFPIKVSDTQSVNKAVLCSSLCLHSRPTHADAPENALENLRRFANAGCRGHRNFGAAALHLAYIADGSVDGYVEYGLHCWDMAAGALLVKEAGGCVIDPTGSDFQLMSQRVLVTSSNLLAKELSKLLVNMEYPPEAVIV